MIFISHTAEDSDLARELKQVIEEAFGPKPTVFVSSDMVSIHAGEKWLDAIKDALERARVVVLLCSRPTIGRYWIQFEMGAAWIRGVRIIPLCHSGYNVQSLPQPLSLLNAISLSDPEAANRLLRAIACELGCDPPGVEGSVLQQRLRKRERQLRRRRAKRTAARAVKELGRWSLLVVAPSLIAAAYWISLHLSGMNYDLAGKLLRLMGFIGFIPLGIAQQHGQESLHLPSSVLSGLVAAMLAGLASTLVIFGTGGDIGRVVLKDLLNAGTFLVAATAGHVLGALFCDRLRSRQG